MPAPPLQISATSLEYVRVRVSAKEAGVVVNPTGDAVTMAFKSDGSTPVLGDFKTASWESDTSVVPTLYFARCLVGTGGAVVLTAATYQVWVKITDAPETPIRKAGLLVVTA